MPLPDWRHQDGWSSGVQKWFTFNHSKKWRSEHFWFVKHPDCFKGQIVRQTVIRRVEHVGVELCDDFSWRRFTVLVVFNKLQARAGIEEKPLPEFSTSSKKILEQKVPATVRVRQKGAGSAVTDTQKLFCCNLQHFNYVQIVNVTFFIQ